MTVSLQLEEDDVTVCLEHCVDPAGVEIETTQRVMVKNDYLKQTKQDVTSHHVTSRSCAIGV